MERELKHREEIDCRISDSPETMKTRYRYVDGPWKRFIHRAVLNRRLDWICLINPSDGILDYRTEHNYIGLLYGMGFNRDQEAFERIKMWGKAWTER